MLLDPRFWLATIVALAAAYGGGRWHQYRYDQKALAADKLEQSETARLRERAAQAQIQRITDGKEASVRRLAAERDAALLRLRDRPGRLPSASSASCAGASPAALAAEDAAVAVGFADEFDRLREEYAACKGYVESLGR